MQNKAGKERSHHAGGKGSQTKLEKAQKFPVEPSKEMQLYNILILAQ